MSLVPVIRAVMCITCVCVCVLYSQFTDEHGEVCPANWVPGKKTMKVRRMIPRQPGSPPLL